MGLYLYQGKQRGFYISNVFLHKNMLFASFPGGTSGKENCLPVQEKQVQSLGWKDSLEEEMATHCSILA